MQTQSGRTNLPAAKRAKRQACCTSKKKTRVVEIRQKKGRKKTASKMDKNKELLPPRILAKQEQNRCLF
jgi:hypothetical protein